MVNQLSTLKHRVPSARGSNFSVLNFSGSSEFSTNIPPTSSFLMFSGNARIGHCTRNFASTVEKLLLVYHRTPHSNFEPSSGELGHRTPTLKADQINHQFLERITVLHRQFYSIRRQVPIDKDARATGAAPVASSALLRLLSSLLCINKCQKLDILLACILGLLEVLTDRCANELRVPSLDYSPFMKCPYELHTPKQIARVSSPLPF
ncbi:hypothetical protein Tco_1254454 [Tanacetum coccineum]